MIAYKDDDGEISNIVTDDELSEAIDFFDDGNDDAPPSSGSSVFSGRSSSSRKITMHVEVNIEFDGRLSDTASLDDYRDDSESQISLSISSTRRELDDDDVTVSSRDYIAASHLSNGRYVLEGESLSQRISNFGWQSTSRPDPIEEGILEDLVNSSAMQTGSETAHVHVEERTLPEDEENTFEELDVISLDFDAPSVNDRHAAWLREQTSLTSRTNLNNIRDRFGPHDLSSQPDSESISGNVALEKDTRGKYYYSYTPASSNDSQEYDTFHEEHQFEEVELPHRPSSMQLAWLASQRVPQANEYITPISISSLGFNEEDVTQMTGEYEPPLPESTTSAPPEIVTECSHCGVLLETIRYVCSTCGPKPPAGTASHSYPPPPLRHPFTSSSRTLVASSSSLPNNNRDRPLPPLPSNNGYELCAECVQSYGIYHAVEGGRDPESPPISGGSTSSFMELQHSSVFHRSAPQKGKLRHAFREQMWEGNKWIDLQQGESSVRVCSMCKNETDKKRYKCAVCLKIHMCQSCYSQVHDLHPKHAFIAVPDVEMSLSFRVPLPQEEQPLLHRGVNCVHCRREIIGARFHCPFCGVDICQNCEAAGLPGNLDASNGGHDSTHIMLKIPYYLDSIK
ncbi:hypothetical protein APHAL10511_004359 [Amanita phalloides]|nr:hypothetical protein APHAL10511_004359 [Amanita phalloides]